MRFEVRCLFGRNVQCGVEVEDTGVCGFVEDSADRGALAVLNEQIYCRAGARYSKAGADFYKATMSHY